MEELVAPSREPVACPSVPTVSSVVDATSWSLLDL